MKNYIEVTRTVNLKIPLTKSELSEEEIDEMLIDVHSSEVVNWEDGFHEEVQLDMDEVHNLVLNGKVIDLF